MSVNKEQIESKLNDLSMVLLTEGELTDKSVKDKVVSYLSVIANIANTLILNDVSDVTESLMCDPELNAQILNTYITSLQTHLRDPKGEFTFGEIESTGTHPDFADDLDQELLVEFVEKHTTGLDDFEALLLDPAHIDSDYIEASRIARGYIHNLKGDAGSLGLKGIESVCHFVEDKIDNDGIKDIIDSLLNFKEWVSSWLKAIAAGVFNAEKSSDFKPRFLESLGSSKSQNNTPNNTSIQADSDFPCANMDLLAELLAEDSKAEEKDLTSEYPIEGDQEVFVEFVTEAEDHLGAVESTILDASGSYDKEMIDTIFRGVHSIKGASSYFKLLEVTETAHHTETLLDEVRSGKRNFDQGLAELILVFVDLQRRLIAAAKQAASNGTKIKPISDSTEYLEQLHNYSKNGKNSSEIKDNNKKIELSNPKLNKEDNSQKASDKSADKGEKLDIKNYVKVETDRLDHLIDAIGEMAIYSSMLIDNVRVHMSGNEHLIKVTHQVEKFGRELQQIGMGMRLIPIRGLFQKMSRLVWDVARKIGKEVKFSMEGEDTELDRTIIEKLADPLMHMIRNAIDHGVEPPDEREKSGKNRAGTIELKAFHSGGNIHIQIIDDGRGLNPEKLINKAREKGIISEHDKLTDKEAYQLIFAAGFSTAAAVTDISGRGVGMDVVRRNIESMRGRVHIDSNLGKGTIFTIELPLTLAIIDGISVKVGPEVFIIPTLSVVEFMQPKSEQINKALDKGETFFFRGKYLPLYRLDRLFEVPNSKSELVEALVVVVEDAGKQFALVVDDIINTHSTVIKSVGEMFATTRGLAGGAIMPSGDIALILDLRSLLELAKDTYRFNAEAILSEKRINI
jgi:two-component system chemotaxis sensor kinase CheA